MSYQFRRRILTLTLLPLPLMLLVCGLLAWQISLLHASLQWVAHTQEVLSTIHLCERLMIDQETGTRGYLYTADPLFLDPSKVSEQHLGSSIANLRRLTTDNASQQSNIDALEKGYNAWFTETLRARQRVAPHAPAVCDAECLAGAAQRKQQMDGLRGISKQIEDEEQRLLTDRKAKASRLGSATIAGVVISLLIAGIVLAIFMSRAIHRIDSTYSKALAERDRSVRNEQKARAAAEALAEEIKEQSLEMEQLYRQMRTERDFAHTRLAELGKG